MNNKPHMHYLDLLRFLAFGMITFFHMLMQLAFDEYIYVTPLEPFYTNANIHIATLGVTLFFMISGAGLMLSCRKSSLYSSGGSNGGNSRNGSSNSNGRINWRAWYARRFRRIFIPFYILYLICLVGRHLVGTTSQVFEKGIPAWRFVFTLLGMDEYAYMCGLTTFTMHIGEWFLGCLVVLYALFPLLYTAMKKNRALLMGIATILYLALVFFYPFRIEMHVNIVMKLYAFVLGMFWLSEDPPPLLAKQTAGNFFLVLSVLLLAAALLSPVPLGIPDELKTTILACAVFIIARECEPLIAKCGWLCTGLQRFSTVSYEIYLVHHVVIQAVSRVFRGRPFSLGLVAMIFALELAAMICCGLILKFLSQQVQRGLQALAK